MTKFRKGNNSGFPTGTVPYNRQRKTVKPSKSDTTQTVYKRLTRKMTSLVQNIPYKDTDTQCVNDTKPAVLLRPRDTAPKIPKTKKSAKKNQSGIWNEKKSLDLLIVRRQCVTNATINQESSNCKRRSANQKPGRKAAKINVSAQAALSQTPLGYTGLRKIVLGCNMPAPSASGLQKRANKVLPEIININKEDMKARRKQLIEINTLRGRKDPGSVSLQADGAYNNAIYSGIGKTPFQPATQVVYSVAEAETEDKSIIGVVCKNKLCSIHPIKSGEKCTSSCSSNLTFMKSIGDEYTWAKEALQDLASDGIEAKHLTTDPDSSAYRAADDLYLENTTSTEPEHFLDTRHFSNNHRKNIKNNKELGEIMPAERCQSEFTQAMEKYGGDFTKVKNKISFTVDAIPACYTGNHELCRRHSFVCKGGKKFWLSNRAFLPNSFKIRKLDENLNAIRKCVLYRLSPSALKKTRLNLNTQKVEGFNRSLRRSLPKNVTYTKNFEGRVHSAIHSVNLGPGESLLVICKQLGAEISPGSAAEKELKAIQKTDRMQKAYKKSMKYKKERSNTRKHLYKIYEKHQEEKCYEKNKLMRPVKRTKTQAEDHPYAKKPRVAVTKKC
ncbi:unnamed protein product [Mytilus edulis]|uniref:Mutator-like transposase domain-containing protein n=1 Tax=Mytilus edulis TaxID=6550 RepID=A0A8S3T7M9_MYTED|nr:unnamed protein product [Mytilus edulis]